MKNKNDSDWKFTVRYVPRNFQIDATGRLLLVGNQDSDSIVAFAIDGASGALRPTGMTYQAPSPVALCFV